MDGDGFGDSVLRRWIQMLDLIFEYKICILISKDRTT